MAKISLITIFFFCLTIQLRAQFSVAARDTVKKDTTKSVFATVDIPPSFPGGLTELNRYLSASLVYPAKAKEDNVTGKVHVTFMVERDGSLTDLKVFKQLTPETDAEALRLIKNSIKWNPGFHNGLTVRQQTTVIVNFQLDDRQ